MKQTIVTTEAVVLRAMDYGESSIIATLFTAAHGKVSVIARGARRPKSKFGSTLEPMSYIEAVIYMKPSRDLQSISDASFIQAFTVSRNSLQRIEIGLRCLELTAAVAQEGEEDRALFGLLVSTLTALGTSQGYVRNLLPYFQIRLASHLGFDPSFTREDVEALSTAEGVLDPETGRISGPGEPGVRAPRSVLRAFAVLSRADASTVLRMRLSAGDQTAVADLVTAYLRHHLQDVFPHRAARVFSKMHPE